MPMQRWIARAAGGTSQRLNPGLATVLALSRKPRLEARTSEAIALVMPPPFAPIAASSNRALRLGEAFIECSHICGANWIGLLSNSRHASARGFEFGDRARGDGLSPGPPVLAKAPISARIFRSPIAP